MLKTCVYCGRIHDSKYKCHQKMEAEEQRTRRRKKADTSQNEFRRRNVWKKKSVTIRERDGYCCRACLEGLRDGKKKLTTNNLSVHHIIPLEENEEYKLDDEWLVTLCEDCHKQAERGLISKEKLHEIAKKAAGYPRGDTPPLL